MKNITNKTIKALVLTSASIAMFGCNDSDISSNQAATYSLASSHAGNNVAVVSFDYPIDVTLASDSNNLQLGTTSSDSATASNVSIHFTNQQDAQYFNVKNTCDDLTTSSSCNITLTPNDQSRNIISNHIVSFYVTATIDSQALKTQVNHFIVKSLTSQNPQFVGNDDNKNKTITVENDTGVDVEFSNAQFNSTDGLSFSNSNCTGILDNSKSCTVDVKATTTSSKTKSTSNYTMTNNNIDDAVKSDVEVLKPIIKIASEQANSTSEITLNPYDNAKITIYNASPVDATGLKVSDLSNLHINKIDTNCQTDGNGNYKVNGFGQCYVTLNAGNNPYGNDKFQVIGGNANASNEILLQGDTPTKLNAGITSSSHITTNSNVNNEVQISVTNHSLYNVSGLSLAYSQLSNNFTTNDSASTCVGKTLRPLESCEFTVEYNPGNVDTSSYPDVFINVIGNDKTTQIDEPLTINNYPEYYNLPQNTSRENDDISNYATKGIFIDNNDTIYVATAAGLSIGTKMFDSEGNFVSINWINLTAADGLYYNLLNSVFVDTDQKIYLGTNSGLLISSKLSQGEDKHNYTWTNTLKGNQVHYTYVANNSIYAATNNGLFISSDNGSSWNQELPDINVNNVYVNGSDVYAATNNGVYISSDNGNTWGSEPTILADQGVNVVAGDENGNLYIGTETNGLYVFDQDLNQVGHLENTSEDNSPIISNNIYSIYIDNTNHEVVLGSNKTGSVALNSLGVSVIMNPQFENNTFSYDSIINSKGQGLLSSSPIKVYEDKEGYIYMAGSNLAVLNPVDASSDSLTRISLLNGVGVSHFPAVIGVAKTENNYIYTIDGNILSQGHLVSDLNDGSYSWETIIGNVRGQSVAVDSKNLYLAAKYYTNDRYVPPGLYVYNLENIQENGTGTTNHYYSWTKSDDSGNLVDVKDVTTNDKNVFVGTTDGLKISTANSDDINSLVWTETLSGHNVTDLYYFNDNSTLYATTSDDGLYTCSINSESIADCTKFLGISNNNLSAVVVDANNIYLGTQGSGLLVIENYNDSSTEKTITLENPITGLNYNVINSLMLDGNTLYVGSNNGLATTDVSNISDLSWNYPGYNDGFGDGSNTIHTVYKGNNSSVYVGYDSGLLVTNIPSNPTN
ncbi:hypothetical protein L3V79_07715 [Thiotrichales bacterium 19S9-12]|nr:hypothetical protein [Thiotrichales bacterium 19S9-11]MCF6812239.1 hypothetical protein [Thiotrichales bacterium 19S9-12]